MSIKHNTRIIHTYSGDIYDFSLVHDEDFINLSYNVSNIEDTLESVGAMSEAAYVNTYANNTLISELSTYTHEQITNIASSFDQLTNNVSESIQSMQGDISDMSTYIDNFSANISQTVNKISNKTDEIIASYVEADKTLNTKITNNAESIAYNTTWANNIYMYSADLSSYVKSTYSYLNNIDNKLDGKITDLNTYVSNAYAYTTASYNSLRSYVIGSYAYNVLSYNTLREYVIESINDINDKCDEIDEHLTQLDETVENTYADLVSYINGEDANVLELAYQYADNNFLQLTGGELTGDLHFENNSKIYTNGIITNDAQLRADDNVFATDGTIIQGTSFVHSSGDEYINGEKTFAEPLHVENGITNGTTDKKAFLTDGTVDDIIVKGVLDDALTYYLPLTGGELTYYLRVGDTIDSNSKTGRNNVTSYLKLSAPTHAYNETEPIENYKGAISVLGVTYYAYGPRYVLSNADTYVYSKTSFENDVTAKDITTTYLTAEDITTSYLTADDEIKSPKLYNDGNLTITSSKNTYVNATNTVYLGGSHPFCTNASLISFGTNNPMLYGTINDVSNDGTYTYIDNNELFYGIHAYNGALSPIFTYAYIFNSYISVSRGSVSTKTNDASTKTNDLQPGSVDLPQRGDIGSKADNTLITGISPLLHTYSSISLCDCDTYTYTGRTSSSSVDIYTYAYNTNNILSYGIYLKRELGFKGFDKNNDTAATYVTPGHILIRRIGDNADNNVPALDFNNESADNTSGKGYTNCINATTTGLSFHGTDASTQKYTFDGPVTATNFPTSSDIRLKNVIGEIDLGKAYDLIDKCSEILYTLKDDETNREQIGMIAQEVEEFFPEIVFTNSDGFKTLDYSRLTVIILRVLKDLINRVKNLETK